MEIQSRYSNMVAIMDAMTIKLVKSKEIWLLNLIERYILMRGM